MKLKISFICLVVGWFALNSCEQKSVLNNSQYSADVKIIELPEGGQELIESANTFSIDVFREICSRSEQGENVFISPLSLSMALSMTCNGAAGTTLEAMRNTLRHNNMPLNDVNNINKTLIEVLPEVDEKVELGLANSIWYKKGYTILDAFIGVNEEYYHAEVDGLDFSEAASKDVINGWVEEQTNNKIKNLIEQIDPSTVMFLINAIYFNADWTIAFNDDETVSQYFNKADGNGKEVEMMQMKDTISYYANNVFSAIELDYGQGNFSMVVLLPFSETTASDMIANLTENDLATGLAGMNKEVVNVQLPKFKFGYGIQLKEVLSAMGMEVAFTPGADFSGINGYGGLCIDYVLQKTFIDVSEKGTEAAAATVVAIMETSAIGGEEERWFVANRPFAFFIREKTTNTILFSGLINEPAIEE